MFREPLAPWIEWRKSQGWDIHLKTWPETPSTEQIQQWVSQENNTQAAAILIVGDCANPQDGNQPWDIPSPLTTDAVPMDSRYGDTNADGIPERAVGRMPVRDEKQLEIIIKKTRDYESLHTNTPPKPTLLLWIGVPSMEAIVKNVKDNFLNFIPASTETNLISGDTPQQEPFLFLESLAHPYNLSVIISHGYPYNLTTAKTPAEVTLSREDLRQLPSGRPNGPLFILACQCGLFNAPERSLAEEFLLHPGGPVTVAATGAKVSHLTNYALAREISNSLSAPSKPKTAGEFLRALLKSAHGADIQKMITADPIAAEIAQNLKIQESRMIALQPQVLSYTLLGDPLATCSFQ
jgi:hypothetical protein